MVFEQTVLLAHRTPYSRERIRETLEEKGWRVIETSHAAEVIPLAKQHNPVVLILDIVIASLEQGDLVKGLKSDPVTCSIPLLFLTSNDPQESVTDESLKQWVSRVSVPDNNLPLLLAHLQYTLARQRHHRPYILVVDDEPDMVDIMTSALTQRGFLASGAYNGAQALDIIRSVHPDAILLDIDMPQVDGWHFLKLLKSMPDMNDIRVVILTGVDQKPEDRRLGLEQGAFAYLLKPCAPDEVVRTIELALKTSKRGRS